MGTILKWSEICHKLRCRIPGSSSCSAHFTFDGTPCGNYKVNLIVVGTSQLLTLDDWRFVLLYKTLRVHNICGLSSFSGASKECVSVPPKL